MKVRLFVSVYLILVGILALSFLLPSNVEVSPALMEIPADGVTQRAVHVVVEMPWVRRVFYPHPKVSVEVIQGPDYISVSPSDEEWVGKNGAWFFIRSRAVEGESVVRFRVHNATDGQLRVFARTAAVDSDSGGFPDSFKLTTSADREAFRKSLCAIAWEQADVPSSEWASDERNSAGLICFSIREALRRHSVNWRLRLGIPIELPSVEKYNFPLTPLGTQIFRRRPGSFAVSDLGNNIFAESVDALELKEFNSAYVGRKLEDASSGDLLFIASPPSGGKSLLVMLMVRRGTVGNESGEDRVVYVPVQSQNGQGRAIRTSYQDLLKSPEIWMRPLAENKKFLGFFRLKILK